jgi:uncharacterized protein YqhQ
VETQINKYMCIPCKRLKISFTRDTSKDADNLKLKAEEEEEEKEKEKEKEGSFLGTSLVRASLILSSLFNKNLNFLFKVKIISRLGTS